MTADVLTIMTSFFRTLGVQVLLLEKTYDSLSEMDYGFRQRMFENFDYETLHRQMEVICEPDVVVNVKDDFQLFYTLFRFPENHQTEYGYEFCLIGPYVFQAVTSSEFYKLMEQKGIPVELHKEAAEFYNKVPLITFYDKWNSMINYYCTLLLGEHIQVRYALRNEFGLFESDMEYRINTVPDLASYVLEERYQIEDEMLKAVASGNAKNAEELYQKFMQYKIMPRTPDPLRNKKNLMFTLNTLLRKAVQSGQVHPLHIDNLSGQFACQIEAVNSLPELSFLSERMIRKYCMLVKNYSRRSYSALVQTCLDYMDFHYAEDLSLDSMAKLCNVSNSYLSALFKKEVNVTLTDYLNSTRIRQALVLLNSSSCSVQDISTLCGFSTANYFARMFKKYQGQSPSEYRDKIRN